MRTRRATGKNALEVAKRDAAVAACPYKEGDLRVLPITEGGKPSRRHRYAYNVLDVTPYEGDE